MASGAGEPGELSDSSCERFATPTPASGPIKLPLNVKINNKMNN